MSEENSNPTPEAQPVETQETGRQETLPEIVPSRDERLALLEAVIYAAEDPPTLEELSEGLGLSQELVQEDLDALMKAFEAPDRGIEIRGVAGGYKMFTKPQHHEAVKAFVKTLRPKLKLSLPALETLAVVAYKQPVTVPEIQAVRGVSAAGVIHTLLKHKLIATAGRKKVVGRPMQYKTTRDFLVQFGLNDLSELPTLKEMEELSRAAIGEEDAVGVEAPVDGEEVVEP